MNREESDISHLRRAYDRSEIDRSTVDSNPFLQFNTWLNEAINAENIIEPTAMTLATVSSSGQPSARTLLLKETNNKGFIFYTNYKSKKGRHLVDNPKAALLFFWDRLERQIRIEGSVEKIDAHTSDKYFATRPKGSQLGAHASPQSTEIDNREILEENLNRLSAEYENVDKVPRPENWGGYILIPTYFEFWQGRLNRLHDRITYTKNGNAWKVARIAP